MKDIEQNFTILTIRIINFCSLFSAREVALQQLQRIVVETIKYKFCYETSCNIESKKLKRSASYAPLTFDRLGEMHTRQ